MHQGATYSYSTAKATAKGLTLHRPTNTVDQCGYWTLSVDSLSKTLRGIEPELTIGLAQRPHLLDILWYNDHSRIQPQLVWEYGALLRQRRGEGYGKLLQYLCKCAKIR